MKKKCIFIVNTIYQGLITAYIINALKEKYDFIILDATEKNYFTKKEEIFGENVYIYNLYPNNDIKYSFIKQIINMKKIYKKNSFLFKKEEDLYLFNDCLPLEAFLAKKTNGKVFFIEEGLSTYREISNLSLENLKNIFKKIICKTIGLSYDIRFGHSMYIDELLLTNPTLFKKKFPKIKKNIRLLNNRLDNKNINKKFIAHFSPEHKEINIEKPIALYLGQPLSENNFIPKEKEIETIKEIKKICEKNGFLFYIKPHPSELSEKYTLFRHILSALIPIELLSAVFTEHKTIILSPFSSANYNLKSSKFLLNIHLHPLFKINVDFNINNIPKAINYIDLENSIKEANRKCI